MKFGLKIALSLFFVFSVFVGQTLPCTTFCLKNKGEILFGKNYDWMIGDGMVFVNKRGVSKWSVIDGEKNPAKWVSKYGNITFNQYGRENPMGGMNEAGLVIELMWLDDTKYPKPDGRLAIDVLEWIQYNLDTAATTAEVIKNSETVRIASPITLHYLVNDKSGNSATIEFLDGNLVAHTGDKLPVPTLTNDTYQRSLGYSRATDPAKAQSGSSLDRFARASQKTLEFGKRERNEKEAVDYAFGILSDAAQANGTQWSIVYDQKRGKIYFRTKQYPQVRSIDAKSFDYACGSPVKILEMNSSNSGDVNSLFKDYTRAANRDLIERSYSGTDFLKSVPTSAKDQSASYPESFPCWSDATKPEPAMEKSATTSAVLAYLQLAFPIYYIYKQLVSS